MNKLKLSKKIVVTGGGSGGHVSAALSIISALEKKYELDHEHFLYIGGDLGMEGEKPGNSLEQKLMKGKPFECKYIRAGKLQRNFSFNTVKLLFRTILGFVDSYKIIKQFKPDITISTGGFVTVHVCLVAKLFKSKIYMHEQTATVGLTNTIVGKIADKIFVSFENSKKYFNPQKTILTGNLVRSEIFNTKGQSKFIDQVRIMKDKQAQYPILYISGGGLGSHLINSTVKECLNLLLQKYQIILQTGENKVFKDYEAFQMIKEGLSKDISDRFIPVTYINSSEIGYVLNNIDLYIGRSGANTVYEIGVLQIPSIFIPIPWVTHNEQYENAKVLKDLGLADILSEGELSPECLMIRIDLFLRKKKQINHESLREIFNTNATELILDSIML